MYLDTNKYFPTFHTHSPACKIHFPKNTFHILTPEGFPNMETAIRTNQLNNGRKMAN